MKSIFPVVWLLCLKHSSGFPLLLLQTSDSPSAWRAPLWSGRWLPPCLAPFAPATLAFSLLLDHAEPVPSPALTLAALSPVTPSFLDDEPFPSRRMASGIRSSEGLPSWGLSPCLPHPSLSLCHVFLPLYRYLRLSF